MTDQKRSYIYVVFPMIFCDPDFCILVTHEANVHNSAPDIFTELADLI